MYVALNSEVGSNGKFWIVKQAGADTISCLCYNSNDARRIAKALSVLEKLESELKQYNEITNGGI